jgi:hypothetical protein
VGAKRLKLICLCLCFTELSGVGKGSKELAILPSQLHCMVTTFSGWHNHEEKCKKGEENREELTRFLAMLLQLFLNKTPRPQSKAHECLFPIFLTKVKRKWFAGSTHQNSIQAIELCHYIIQLQQYAKVFVW